MNFNLFFITFFYHLSLGFSEDSKSISDFDARNNDSNDNGRSDDDDWPSAKDGYPASGSENIVEVLEPEPVIDPKVLKQYQLELQAGDPADLLGTNQHHFQDSMYPDFGRRFVPQYPYTENIRVQNGKEMLLPKLAPPELVLSVAKESALLEASIPMNPTDEVIRKDILRTGDYWNGVWKEDVNPDKLLRSHKKNAALVSTIHMLVNIPDKLKAHPMEVLNLRIKPGSDLYQLAMTLKAISPRLLYIINKDKQK